MKKFNNLFFQYVVVDVYLGVWLFEGVGGLSKYMVLDRYIDRDLGIGLYGSRLIVSRFELKEDK